MVVYQVSYSDFYGTYEGKFLVPRESAVVTTPELNSFNGAVEARLRAMYGADAVFTWSFAERVVDHVVETHAL